MKKLTFTIHSTSRSLAWAFCIVAVVLFVSVSVLPWAANAQTTATRVVGYYPAWVIDMAPADTIDFTTVTNVVYAFVWPETDGSLSGNTPLADPALMAVAHEAGRPVSIAVGGGGQSAGFPAVTADEDTRAQFIANLFDFCDLHGYDGIDFDWESPVSQEERDNYASLVKDVRAEADRRDRPMLISMAISAASWASWGNDVADLAGTVDWFFMMGYDYSGPWTPYSGHNAPLHPRMDLGYWLSVTRSIDYLITTRKLPPSSIVVGMPFYGRRFQATDIYRTATGGDALRYNQITPLVDQGGWVEHWDGVALVPYLINNAGTEVIVYDNAFSIELKSRYVLDYGLGGVGVWALGYDVVADGQPLMDAVALVMSDGVFVADRTDGMRPQAPTLGAPYPNPFNAVTSIPFNLPHGTRVKITVYTILGQKAAELFDGFLGAGNHTVTWVAGDMPSGVYIVGVETDGYRMTEKTTLMK